MPSGSLGFVRLAWFIALAALRAHSGEITTGYLVKVRRLMPAPSAMASMLISSEGPLREYPASRVAPVSLLIPVSGIVSSMLILGERPGAAQWQAVGLILLALIVGLKKGRPLWVRQDGHA